MNSKEFLFEIVRYKPGVVDPSKIEAFNVDVHEGMTVMDCLEKIRILSDKTLMYRHSCHHASCGTCAMIINGKERLACKTDVFGLDAAKIVLSPLKGFPIVGDLVVDMKDFFSDMGDAVSILRPSENTIGMHTPETTSERFENCIECGSCDSACPQMDKNRSFLGPAVLAAVNRDLEKYNDKDKGAKVALLEKAGSARGAKLCERALDCSKVCPKKVYPGKHIHLLKRELGLS